LYFCVPTFGFDPHGRTLWRKNKRILLTPREAQTLTLLLQAPGCYITTTLLADWLSPPQGEPVYEHSVEQTICGLRKKLGESGKRQHILKTQSGSGYGIFPQNPDESTKLNRASPDRNRRRRIPEI
jgi:DNA-binding response OmpR family regulator